ncbi:hypothetical protein D3C75_1065800 [compost metagenome]
MQQLDLDAGKALALGGNRSALAFQQGEHGWPVQLAVATLQAGDGGQADAQPQCLPDQLHPGHVLLAVVAIAVQARHWRQQAACLVQADGLGAGAGTAGDFGNAHRFSPASAQAA